MGIFDDPVCVAPSVSGRHNTVHAKTMVLVLAPQSLF